METGWEVGFLFCSDRDLISATFSHGQFRLLSSVLRLDLNIALFLLYLYSISKFGSSERVYIYHLNDPPN